MPKPHRYFEESYIHVCTICGMPFEWNNDARWFGNFDEVLYKACSEKCFKIGCKPNDDIIDEEM